MGRGKKRRRHGKDSVRQDNLASSSPPVEAKTEPATPSASIDKKSEGITPGVLAADFVLQMEALKQTLAVAGGATEVLETQTQNEFEKFAERVGGIRKVIANDTVSISVPAVHTRAADRIYRAVDVFQRGKQALASNFLVALVAEFDVFLAQMLRWLWSKNPATFGLGQKAIRMDELKGLVQVSDVEMMLLEREVDELLRGSRSDQFAWFEKNLKVSLGTEGERWSEFIEAHERRHLCVHTGCRVSRQYVAACQKLGIKDIPGVGDSIRITPQYIGRVASIFSEMAVMMAQVIWRKVEGDPHKDADEQLTDTTYKLLEDGKFRLAATLLEFGLKFIKKPSSERARKVWLINYAQALKRMDRENEVREVLDREDWSAASEDFKMALAILREDFESAANSMRKVGREGGLSEADYRDWPLFEEFRKTDHFLAVYRDMFGVDFSAIEIGSMEVRFVSRKGQDLNSSDAQMGRAEV